MANFLSFELEKKAQWRARKAERHQEDPRNQAAVDLLHKLSEQVAKSDEAERLSHIESDVEHEWYDQFGSTRDEVLTDIGFRFAPESIDDVAKEILSRLQ